MGDSALTNAEIFAALGLLFAVNSRNCGEMIGSIQESDIRKAYRKKALQTHPDRYASMGEAYQKQCSERFIRINNAYELLVSYVKTLEDKPSQPPPRDAGMGFSSGGAEFYSRGESHSGGEFYSRQRRSAGAEGRNRDPRGRPDDRFSRGHRAGDGYYYNGSFWQKGVPQRNLRFGEFLYYSGIIPWRIWVRALAWQNTQRPRIGEIAQRWRWATELDIAGLLSSRRRNERLGELMLDHQMINPFQLRVLLLHQKKLQKPIGEYFYQQALLSRAEIQSLLLRQSAHNIRHPASR